MRKCLLFILLMPLFACGQNDPIYLLIRADDIGFCHAANEACIEVFEKGISRSVEIMVPTPWFPEAVEMLQAHPTYDVGIHLCLTSEWHYLKWRPLTNVPSLVDENGYFVPTYWKSPDREVMTFGDLDWKEAEVEQELRAQIEMATRHLPHISHLSFHMGGNRFDPRIDRIYRKLAREYDLDIDLEKEGFQYARLWENGSSLSPDQKVEALKKSLSSLEAGKWWFLDHPAYDVPEVRSVWHKGYEKVAQDRQGVTTAWTHPEVLAIIKARNIKLVSYLDVKNGLD